MTTSEITGSCLCGEVRYRVRPPFTWFHYCHCSRCRKRTGSAHSANLLVAVDQVEWLAGSELAGRYELPGAKSFSTAWCTRCGSALPWTTKNGRWIVVPAGGLEVDPGARPERNIFWESRAVWYAHVSELPTFAELPPRE
jgi:hypothetical protein